LKTTAPRSISAWLKRVIALAVAVARATWPPFCLRYREDQILGLVVGVEGGEVLQRDRHRFAGLDAEIEIPAGARGYVANLRAQMAARLERKLAEAGVAGDRTGAVNVDQVLDDNVALQGCRALPRFRWSCCRSIFPSCEYARCPP
jgi:hypothetical protein